ncbi:hypothetical protein AQJ11_13215 [Streptomyces corchorusii]|uniref:Uncharacterized protein n=1 Tax=Streptomyces corchorusii TaxID=1903 RepID=A0A124HNB0_STRCK|nr:hypothetical protein AQJ11_13215 [Streptomyces corchorusii]
MGKTMLSVALGRAAVDAGRRVYFTTAAGDVPLRDRAAAICSMCPTNRAGAGPPAALLPGLLHLLDLRLE